MRGAVGDVVDSGDEGVLRDDVYCVDVRYGGYDIFS